MNYLSHFYTDDFYRYYTETNPLLPVCVIGNCAEEIQLMLLQAEGAQIRLCVTILDSVDSLRAKHNNKNGGSPGNILKSNWCFKHQKESFSCIVLALKWEDMYTNGAVNEIMVARLETAKKKLRNSYCKIITIGITTDKNEPDESLCSSARRAMITLLGENYGTFMMIKQGHFDVDLSDKLRAVVISTSMEFCKKEIVRLKEKKANLNRDGTAFYAARLHYKIAWYYLITRELSHAKGHFQSALNYMYQTNKNHPSIESRICGDIFLRNIINLSGAVYFNSDLYRQIKLFIKWVGKPLFLFNSPQQDALGPILKHLLEADWIEYLAKNTQQVPSIIQGDLLISAVYALKKIEPRLLTEMEDSPDEKIQITSPAFLGSECSSLSYSNVILGSLTQPTMLNKMHDLLDEAASKGKNRQHEINYLQLIIPGRDELKKNISQEMLLNFSPGPIFTSTIYTRLLFDENARQYINGTVATYYFINGCVQPYDIPAQEMIFNKFHSFYTENKSSSLSVSYPKGCLNAPFTALVSFKTLHAECEADKVAVSLELFSTYNSTVNIKNLKLIFTSINNNNNNNNSNTDNNAIMNKIVPAENKFAVPVSQSISLSGAGCSSACIDVDVFFPKPSTYMCSGVIGIAEMFNAKGSESVSVIVQWNFPRETVGEIKATEAFPLVRRINPLVKIVSPTSFLTVDCPNAISVVEGETSDFVMNLKSGLHMLTEGTLYIPYVKSLYTCEVHCANEHAAAQKNIEDGSFVFSLPNIPSTQLTTVRVSFKWSRAGVYAIPLYFSYQCINNNNNNNNSNSTDAHHVEISKKIKVSIDAPFNVSYTLINSVAWYCDDLARPDTTRAPLYLPLVKSSIFTLHERNILAVSDDKALAPLFASRQSQAAAGGVENTSMDSSAARRPPSGKVTTTTAAVTEDVIQLSYALREAADCSGAAAAAGDVERSTRPQEKVFTVEADSTLTLTVKLSCWAIQGLTVSRVDLIVGEQVELLYTSAGDLPCSLEKGEEATVVAGLHVPADSTSTSPFLAGFLRVLFTPYDSLQQLFVDLSLPEMRVEPRRLQVTAHYASSAAKAEPFPYTISIRNVRPDAEFRGLLKVISTEEEEHRRADGEAAAALTDASGAAGAAGGGARGTKDILSWGGSGATYTMEGCLHHTFTLAPEDEVTVSLRFFFRQEGEHVLPHFRIINTADNTVAYANMENLKVCVH